MRTIYTNLKWRSPKTDLPEIDSRVFFYRKNGSILDGFFIEHEGQNCFCYDCMDDDIYLDIDQVICWTSFIDLRNELSIGAQLFGF